MQKRLRYIQSKQIDFFSIKRVLFLFISVLVGVVSTGIFPKIGQAAPLGFYLVASSPVVLQSNIEVQIRTNSTFAPNVVQSNLSYDATKLEFQNVNTAGTKYEMGVEESGGNGLVKIARATFSAASGDHLVATVRFKALVDTGASQINFSNGSAMTDGATTETANQPLLVTFTSQSTPTPAPTGTQTILPTPKPVAVNQNQPIKTSEVPETVPPVISNATISGITMTSAMVSWRTNEPTTGMVAYGTDETYGNLVESTQLSTEHAVVFDTNKVQPFTLYNYKIVTKDAAGNETALPNQSFSTNGVTVVMRITDQANKPLKSAVVTIDGSTKTTDDSGSAHFIVGLGPHDVTIQYGKLTRVERFTVLSPKTEVETQEFVVAIKTPVNSPVITAVVGISAIASLATIVFALIRVAHRPQQTTTPVV